LPGLRILTQSLHLLRALHSSCFDQIQKISHRSNIVNTSTTSPYVSNAVFKKEKRMRNLRFVKRMTALALALMFLVASSVTRIEAAPANNLTPEQIEAIARNMFDKFAAMDAQGTASLFAPDGTIEDPVGTTPIQGTQAIIAYLETFPTILDEIRIQSFDVTVAGQEAALKWRLRFKTKTGNVFFVDGIGILAINAQGKVQSDREYFDLAYFQAQLQQ
jgi:ketosteroid isomerase-like protein